MPALIFSLFLFAVAAAAGAWWLARRLQAQSGLPMHARVVYSDTGAWKVVEKPLYSSRYLLTGKPDYVVESDGVHVPVEVKPNRGAEAPHEHDVMQLAAYCLLVGERYGDRPSHGLLKYRDRVFRVEFTDQLEGQLLTVLEGMRGRLGADDVSRSHANPLRCRACGYLEACGQQLNNE